jgi:hypothetical protein
VRAHFNLRNASIAFGISRGTTFTTSEPLVIGFSTDWPSNTTHLSDRLKEAQSLVRRNLN